MRRLIHTLGRWRGTHCDWCAHRLPFTVTGLATGHGNRHVHLTRSHCDDARYGRKAGAR